jgi:hypothetical protein
VTGAERKTTEVELKKREPEKSAPAPKSSSLTPEQFAEEIRKLNASRANMPRIDETTGKVNGHEIIPPLSTPAVKSQAPQPAASVKV